MKYVFLAGAYILCNGHFHNEIRFELECLRKLRRGRESYAGQIKAGQKKLLMFRLARVEANTKGFKPNFSDPIHGINWRVTSVQKKQK